MTGHVPFEAPTPLESVQQQLSGTPGPVNAYRPDAPGWCQAIVDRAIARTPDDRFATAEAFRTTLLAAISEATESTGVFSVVPGTGVARPDALTTAIQFPGDVPTATEPQPQTVSTWAQAVAGTPAPAPVADAAVPTGSAPLHAPGTTVVLKRHQFALMGGLLLALIVGVIVLAIAALRRPATIILTSTDSPPPAATSPQSAASASPAAPSGDTVVPATVPSTSPPTSGERPARTSAGSTAPPLEVIAPPLVLPVPLMPARPATAPLAAVPVTRPGLVSTPFTFEARAVVADGDRRREREAVVLVAEGNVTVSEKDKNAKALYVVPLDSVLGLTYSNSRQPLWDSPEGPAEAMRVEGGAFGFLKGGRNNWFGLRTAESLLVLRVDDNAVGRVTAGLQERTGLTMKRLVEPKD